MCSWSKDSIMLRCQFYPKLINKFNTIPMKNPEGTFFLNLKVDFKIYTEIKRNYNRTSLKKDQNWGLTLPISRLIIRKQKPKKYSIVAKINNL